MTETSSATLVSFSLPVQNYQLTFANGLQSVTVPFSFEITTDDSNAPNQALIVAREKISGKIVTTFARLVSESASNGTTFAAYSGNFEYFREAGNWGIQAIGLADTNKKTSQLLSIETQTNSAPAFLVTSDDTTSPRLILGSFAGIGTQTAPIYIDASLGTNISTPQFAFDSNLSYARASFNNAFGASSGFEATLYANENSEIVFNKATPSGKYSASSVFAMDYFGNQTRLSTRNLLSDFSDGIYVINPDKPGILDSGFSNGKFWIRFSEQITINDGQFYLSLESSIGGLNYSGISATDTQKITWNDNRDTAYLDLSDSISRSGTYTLRAVNLNISDMQGNQEITSYSYIKEQDFKGPTQNFSELQINESTQQDQQLSSMLALPNGSILVSYGNFTDTESGNGSASFAVLQKNEQGTLQRIANFDLDLNPNRLGSVTLQDGGFAILGISPDFSSRPTVHFFNADGSAKDGSPLVIPSHGLDGVYGAMGNAPWNYSASSPYNFIITRSGNELKAIFTETRSVFSDSYSGSNQNYVVAYRFNQENGQYQLSNPQPEIVAQSTPGSVYTSLTALPDGGFLMVENANYSFPLQIKVQRYKADLAPAGSPLQLSLNDFGGGFYPLDNGQLAFIYRSESVPGAWGPGTTGEIRGKIFALKDTGIEQVVPPNAAPGYDGFLIEQWNTNPPSTLPKISPDAKFLIYDDAPGLDERSVRIKPFDIDTQQVGENFYDLGDYRWGEQFNGQLVTLSDGSVFSAWTSYLQDESGTGVFGRMITDDLFNPVDDAPPEPIDGIHGDEKNDTLHGTDGSDMIFGYGGDDHLFGLDGDDVLSGGTGDDLIDGGDGIDTADYSEKIHSVQTTLNGSAFSDVQINGRTEDRIQNVENIIAGAGNDILKGDKHDNRLVGNSGNDILHGGAGANVLVGGTGDDRYFVDSSEDIIIELISDNTSDQQAFSIGNYNDVVIASVSYTLSPGAAIEDMIAAGSITRSKTNSNINLTGNELGQGLMGNEGRNILNGKMGDDILIGMGGNDYLLGEEGNDTFFSGTGNDIMDGGNGEDTFLFNMNAVQGSGFFYEPFRLNLTGGRDLADGGMGNDALFVDSSSFGKVKIVRNTNGPYEFTVTAGNRDNIQIKNIEKIIFGKIASEGLSEEKSYVLSHGAGGSSNDDWIIGTAGNDVISGHDGSDVLDGSRGNDRLKGGLGNDVLIGGAGRDYFEFDSILSHSTNLDKVLDFTRGYDKLVLDSDIFTQLERVSAKNLISGTTSQLANRAYDADDFLIFNRQTKILSYDPTGFGGSDAIAFAELNGVNILSFSDFLVI